MNIANLLIETSKSKNIYKPELFRISNPKDRALFDALLTAKQNILIHDEIEGQLRELIKIENPSLNIRDVDVENKIAEKLANHPINHYGVWVYYPWSNRVVHILDKDEFIEVRTNRNQYKITKNERDSLSSKKIGIIGLSVGQSVALTLATERVAGELVLADFDTLELSNLNRIRSGVHNLGISKVVLAARDIAEIDPFINVTCFAEGVNENNIDDFFTLNGKLDLLVEECDGLDIKILARLKARAFGVPVVMDTSDRGMLDVERFDLDESRPILHGLIDNLDLSKIKALSDEEKVPIILQILGLEDISVRGKVSMIEVKQSINSWPQLASSVTLGGALVTDVSRRILLNQFSDSGRYYIDLEKIISDKHKINLAKKIEALIDTPPPISVAEMKEIAARCPEPKEVLVKPSSTEIKEIVSASCWAPSTGNDQPWKWLYDEQKGILFLFHNESRSFSFGDFQKIASYITFGAAFENLYLYTISNFDFEAEYKFFPITNEQRLVASISFKPKEDKIIELDLKNLSDAIYKRHTNRNLAEKVVIDNNILSDLKQYAESIDGTTLQWITENEDLLNISKIIGACDRMRLLNDRGHFDFVKREMRWTEAETLSTKDGISIQTLGLSPSELSALKVIKSEEVIKEINAINGGQAFAALASKTIKCASALCFISMPKYDLNNFFEGGRAMERFWLRATNLGLAVHPLISPLYLFPRMLHSDGEGLTENNISELKFLRQKFHHIFNTKDECAEVFLCKIGYAPEPNLKSLRLPIENVLIFSN